MTRASEIARRAAAVEVGNSSTNQSLVGALDVFSRPERTHDGCSWTAFLLLMPRGTTPSALFLIRDDTNNIL